MSFRGTSFSIPLAATVAAFATPTVARETPSGGVGPTALVKATAFLRA